MPCSRAGRAAMAAQASSACASLRDPFEQQLVDARPVEVDDLDPPSVPVEVLAHVRDAPETRDQHARRGVEIVFVLVRQLAAAEQFRAVPPPAGRRRPAANRCRVRPPAGRCPVRRTGCADHAPIRSLTVTMPVTSPYSSTTSASDCCSSRKISSSFSACVDSDTNTAGRSSRNRSGARSSRRSSSDFTSSTPSTSASPPVDRVARTGVARISARFSSKAAPASSQTMRCAASSGFPRCGRPGASPGSSCCVRRRRSGPARGFRSPAGGFPPR